MILKQFCFFTAVLLLYSCSNKENSEVINHLNTSILSSNKFITSFTQNEYQRLIDNLSDPITEERAKKWQPISSVVKKLRTGLFKEINTIRESLSTNTNVPNQLIISDKLNNFRISILSLDPAINSTFSKDEAFIQLLKTDSLYQNFANTYKEKNLLLSTLQNNILIIENRVVTFCKNQTERGCILRFDKSSVLVGQNTTHLKAGELLEITAGVGSYSIAANPQIKVNGTLVPTKNGTSIFKFRVINKPGKYQLPVKIEYLNESGDKIFHNIDVEYYIDQ